MRKMSPANARPMRPAMHAFVASALRSIETENEGLAALATAVGDGLGAAFVAAVEEIRRARQRCQYAWQGRRYRTGAAASPRSLSAQPGSNYVGAYAARFGRRAGHCASRKQRLHRD